MTYQNKINCPYEYRKHDIIILANICRVGSALEYKTKRKMIKREQDIDKLYRLFNKNA